MSLPLHKILAAKILLEDTSNFRSKVPPLIESNLKKEFGLRPYQQEAFGRFVYYWEEYNDRPKNTPGQLLFHMATGSGKTLIMAGMILYLYEKGYRNFLFFVNSNNIIEKTRDNFLNTKSSKYLFSDIISSGEKKIVLKEVDNFQAANQDDINIVFSTIQGLHARLNTPKENSLTYADFEDEKIVLISDEAHHINAETKRTKLGAEETENLLSWESTVNRIFQANKENVLLEFTATADFSIPEIEKKYKAKIIFDYSLKQFRQDGYSKEVRVLQSDLSSFERAIQAILLNQYRLKVFEKYGQAIKPVILFKSRTIKESQAFLEEFIAGIKKLKISDLTKIRDSNPEETIQKVFTYLEANNISLENFLLELQGDFSEENLISVNSKEESEQKQLAVNSLEDLANEYRAVFAVDKLNEGWDVLNLFDIVRLYNTRDGKKSKPGKTTMAEAQLIGRGARYCPFKITDAQEFYKRKFDDNLTNELRICEELFYHSAYNPRYIQELNEALVQIGMRENEVSERRIEIKEAFKQTEFYKKGVIYLNSREKNTGKAIHGLSSSIMDKTYEVQLRSGYSKAITIFSEAISPVKNQLIKNLVLSDLGEHILRKALNKLVFYEFSNLKVLFPELKSISEFINSSNYLGKIKLEVSGAAEQLQHLSSEEKLETAIKVLDEISLAIASGIHEFTGTKEFTPYQIRELLEDKTIRFKTSQKVNEESAFDVSKKPWYALDAFFGSKEEQEFINQFDESYEMLVSKYKEVYLLKNERFLKVYAFENGQHLHPEFILFMSDSEQEINYQLFINVKAFQQENEYTTFYHSLSEHLPVNISGSKSLVIDGISLAKNPSNSLVLEKEIERLIDRKV